MNHSDTFEPVPRFCALVATSRAGGRSLSLAVAAVRRARPDLALAVLEAIGSWPNSEPELAELQRQWCGR